MKIISIILSDTQLYIPVTAIDADVGINAIQNYRFTNGKNGQSSQVFQLSLGDNINDQDIYDGGDRTNQLDPRLIVSAPLDRETTDRYEGWLEAFDGGSPPNSGKLSVIIVVTDVNDNQPVFDRYTYETHVPEDLAVGSIVLNVSATDMDIEENGRIQYSMQRTSASQFFNIDPQTGDVFLSKVLDYEQQTSHTLIITAKDSGPGSIPVVTKATIHVKDTNDNSPTLSFVNSPIFIPENKEPGVLVTQFTVEDKDGGENGLVNCGLEEENDFELKQHHTNVYLLVTRRVLDREETEKYRIGITCRDQGWPSLDTTDYLEVSVQDENDNSPKFNSSRHEISTSESSPVGTKLFQTLATDDDVGNNSLLVYTFKVIQVDLNPRFDMIFGEDSNKNKNFNSKANKEDTDKEKLISSNAKSVVENWMFLDPKINLFVVKNQLDYEFATKFVIEILVSDQGYPVSRTASTLLVVNVLDANDQPPVFSMKAYSFGTTENKAASTEIGHVTAYDFDSSLFNQFKFAIAESKSGFEEIYQHHYGSFNHRDQNEETFQSAVKEKKLISSYEIANKNSKYKQLNDSIHMRHHNKHHPHINDLNHSHRHLYHFQDRTPNPNDWFSIDQLTGKITTTRQLDREQHAVYRFWVTATDTSPPHYVASAEITVNVADVNDNAPLITFPAQHQIFQISPQVKRGHFIAKMVASDADVGENARLTYSIGKGNEDELFTIDHLTGELLVAKDGAFTGLASNYDSSFASSPDIEATYKLVIMVKDSGVHEKSAVVNIEISINKSLQLISGIDGYNDLDSNSFLDLFSNINIDPSTFTGKYLLCLIATISFIFVVVIIVAAVFTRRICLRKRKKQTLVLLKKQSFTNNTNNGNNNSNNNNNNNSFSSDFPANVKTTSNNFTLQIKNSNVENHYATVKNNKVKTPLDRSSPYFKSIDISNEINLVSTAMPMTMTTNNDNYYSPRLATLKMNGMSTFQRQHPHQQLQQLHQQQTLLIQQQPQQFSNKTMCHEDALKHLSEKNGYLLVKRKTHKINNLKKASPYFVYYFEKLLQILFSKLLKKLPKTNIYLNIHVYRDICKCATV
ncbi:hypothetical protein HELRODRAFT_159227 [Helobdella robusta]|uniref:Cadherin domain-containing protein n=1 Tax=Helobdella robusta TaxID=6412 RepID=T1ENR7_HELRO|nr:hypothetical protein HELRODRAFT_159227 [Helobdella robusta]ESO12651.1 hypothetical protein HELRODRAFT_159227 [Helobdella robusta]